MLIKSVLKPTVVISFMKINIPVGKCKNWMECVFFLSAAVKV